MRLVITAAVTAGLMLAASAIVPATAQRSGPSLLERDDLWGTDPSAREPATAGTNHLAKCLADPTDRESCFLAADSENDGGLESAVQGQLEVFTIDVCEGETGGVCGKPQTAARDPQPAQAPAPQSALKSVEIRILFDTNDDRIRADEADKIGQIARAIDHEVNAEATFAVIGHTDAVGSDDDNCNLSRRRAISVVNELAYSGVDTGRLIAMGAGEFLLYEETGGASQKNRRVGFAAVDRDQVRTVAQVSQLCGGG